MSSINRPRINRRIETLVRKHWKSDHTMTTILAQADLIKELQELSDDTIVAALTEAYDEGCHDTIKRAEEND